MTKKTMMQSLHGLLLLMATAPWAASAARVIVESTFHVGFFDLTALQPPTQGEVDILLNATAIYYNDILSSTYSNLVSVDTMVIETLFDDETDTYPVQVDFDVIADFTTAAVDDPIPTREELVPILQQTDYNSFIQFYLWDRAEGTLFYDTQRVAYAERDASTVLTVVPSTMLVRFLPIDYLREPTQDEMDRFMTAASEFYTDMLHSNNFDASSYAETVLGAIYFDANAPDNYPLQVYFDAEIRATHNESATSPDEVEIADMMKEANYTDFVQSYVWNYGYTTLFYDTLRVAYIPRLTSSTPPDSTAPSTMQPTTVPQPTLVPVSDVPSLTYGPSTVPNMAPSYSDIPSTVPHSEGPSWLPLSDVPSLTYGPSTVPNMAPSIVPSGIISSLLINDAVAGDVNLGHCYIVERYLQDAYYANGCHSTELTFTYYNGGYDANYEDTGYPQEVYQVVTVDVTRDCNDQVAQPNTCSISVNGVGTCNECSYDNWKVTMEDCSNLGDIFAPGSHTVAFFFDRAPESPYNEKFFPLSYDEDHCLHPVYTSGSDVPSYSDMPSGAGPSWVPLSDAPSFEEPTVGPPSYIPSMSEPPSEDPSWATSSIPSLSEVPNMPPSIEPTPLSMIGSYLTGDAMLGNVNLGHCYTIERSYQDGFYTNGCHDTKLTFQYYNGGYNDYFGDLGYPQELYQVVQVDITHSCNDQVAQPDTCSITVNGVGTCNECSYDSSKVTMVDCSNLGNIFAPGNHKVGFFYDGAPELPYNEKFFPLSYDEEHCLHPVYTDGSQVPSYSDVPSGPGPSYVPYSSAPSWVPLSEVPSMTYGPSLVPNMAPSYSDVPSLLPPSIVPSFTGPPSMNPSSEGPSFTGEPTISTTSEETFAETFLGTVIYCDSQGSYGHLVGPCHALDTSYCIMQDLEECVITTQSYLYNNRGVGTGTNHVQYARVKADVKTCPDPLLSECTISVGDVECNECTHDGTTLTMVDCSNLPEDAISFSPGQQTITVGNMDEYFDIVNTDEMCNHPSVIDQNTDGSQSPNAAPSLVPISDAPSLTIGPSTVPNMAPSYSDVPSLLPPSIVPSVEVSIISSLLINDAVAGDVNLGHCYTVERYLQDAIYSNGCRTTQLTYTYYNGGYDANYEYTGYPQVVYDTVTVDVTRDCNDQVAQPNICSISVNGVGTCNDCSYDSWKVTTDDCSNFGDIFAPGSHTVAFFFDGAPESPYNEKFYPLSFDEDKCLHPVYTDGSQIPSYSDMPSGPGPSQIPYSSSPSEGPSVTDQPSLGDPATYAPSAIPNMTPSYSDTPSLIPPSIVPSVEVSMISSFATMDRVAGDVSQGHCYTVNRYMEDTFYSNGCSSTKLEYTYYNGGTDANYEDTGHPQVTYEMVTVDVMRDCDDQVGSPDRCSISVAGYGGFPGTCNECYYDMGEVTLIDCTNLGDTFPPGSHTVAFFFDGAPESPYYEKFYPLSYDQEMCLHPVYTGASVVPSLVPVSDAPSLTYGPSEVPNMAPSYSDGPSSVPYQAPSYSDIPTTVPSSDVPSGTGTPTTVPSSDAPSMYYDTGAPSHTDPPSTAPTVNRGSTGYCGDTWSFGVIEPDTCYAVDSGYCATQNLNNGCVEVSQFWLYYNQDVNTGANAEAYGYVSAYVKTCPDGSVNHCQLYVGSGRCNQCSSDGRTLTMVDCSNVPSSSALIDGTLPAGQQTITLQVRDAFEILPSDNMCNHPSVVEQTQAGLGFAVAPGRTAPKNVTLTIPTEIKLSFRKGHGVDELDLQTEMKFMSETLRFFIDELKKDPAFATTVLDISADKVTMTSPSKDHLLVGFATHIVLESGATTMGTQQEALRILGDANWNHYLGQYLQQRKSLLKDPVATGRSGGSASSDVLGGISKVLFKGIGNGKVDQ